MLDTHITLFETRDFSLRNTTLLKGRLHVSTFVVCWRKCLIEITTFFQQKMLETRHQTCMLHVLSEWEARNYYETLRRCVEIRKTELEGRYRCFQSFERVDRLNLGKNGFNLSPDLTDNSYIVGDPGDGKKVAHVPPKILL